MCMMMHSMDHSEHNDQHVRESQPSATEILKRRYAQGEITSEQFKEMMQVLSTTGSEPAHAHHENS